MLDRLGAAASRISWGINSMIIWLRSLRRCIEIGKPLISVDTLASIGKIRPLLNREALVRYPDVTTSAPRQWRQNDLEIALDKNNDVR